MREAVLKNPQSTQWPPRGNLQSTIIQEKRKTVHFQKYYLKHLLLVCLFEFFEATTIDKGLH